MRPAGVNRGGRDGQFDRPCLASGCRATGSFPTYLPAPTPPLVNVLLPIGIEMIFEGVVPVITTVCGTAPAIHSC